MTLTQLEYVVAVATHLSFSRAASECGVAQPTLSVQIQKLEKELGVYIFERSGSRVRLTEAGQELAERARKILLEASQLRELAAFRKKDPRGTLRLGIIPTIAPFLIPYVLPAFSREYPGVQVEIVEDKTETLVKMLNDNLIDVALLSTPRKIRGNFYEKFLYNEPFVIYAARGHELLKKKSLALHTIESMQPVLLDETHCMRDQVESICGKGLGTDPLSLRRGTLQTLLSIVEVQGGFTLVPWLMAQSLGPAQSRQVRAILSPAPCRKVSLLYHGTFVNRPTLEALHRVIRENLPRELLGARRAEKVFNPAGHHF